MSDDRDEWSAWKQRTFGSGYEIWHEGLAVEAVASLRGPERERALGMLRLGLSLGDEHAAQALAVMADEASAAAVRRFLERASGSPRVRIAVAMHLAAPEPALSRHLIAVLRGGDEHFGARVDAAIGLRHFAGAADEAALLEAVGDRDYLVRYHACESLLRRRGRVRVDLPSTHPRLFERIRGPQDGPPAAKDVAAALELLRAVKPRA